MKPTWKFFAIAFISGSLLSQCTHAKTPEPYASEMKTLQQQAKAATKAANKEVAQERKARAKACDKSYASRGAQLDVGGRVGCQ